jgi:hypothetical protein
MVPSIKAGVGRVAGKVLFCVEGKGIHHRGHEEYEGFVAGFELHEHRS